MWIRNPGRNKAILLLAALALVVLITVQAWPKTEKAAKPGAPPTAPVAAPVAPVAGPEITFNGKVFCSLKRRVDLPFKGTITSILVHSGEQVKPGQVLARFRLAPESMALIRQRLSPPQIVETQVRLANLERTLGPLQSKKRELTSLVENKLAPAQSLEEVKRNIRLVNQERAALQSRLHHDKQLAQDDRKVLQNLLGQEISPDRIPHEAALLAPIGGYIIWVSPILQEGAMLEPTPGVFQVGVMDPMLVRAQAFEIEALQIKPGETAEVTFESIPNQKFQGRVSRISWSSLTPGLEQPAYYDVELKVPNPGLLLKDGLKAQIMFRKSRP
jgi:multidrug efflux pump subunit AcrA (membrane-fusion protein)